MTLYPNAFIPFSVTGKHKKRIVKDVSEQQPNLKTLAEKRPAGSLKKNL